MELRPETFQEPDIRTALLQQVDNLRLALPKNDSIPAISHKDLPKSNILNSQNRLKVADLMAYQEGFD
jgi:hypothetical protein